MKNKINKRMVTSLMLFALSIYSSEKIYDSVLSVNEDADGVLIFETVSGRRGFIERNAGGDWDVWVGGDLLAVIEDEIWLIMNDKPRNIFADLEKIEKLYKSGVSQKSKLFLDSLKQAIQNLIKNAPDEIKSELNGRTFIESAEYIYINGKKVTYGLN